MSRVVLAESDPGDEDDGFGERAAVRVWMARGIYPGDVIILRAPSPNEAAHMLQLLEAAKRSTQRRIILDAREP